MIENEIGPGCNTSKSTIISKILEIASPHIEINSNPEVLKELIGLTNSLINVYKNEGLLDDDPFSEISKRRIHLYADQLKNHLLHKTILVTGGAGFVGKNLIKALSQFEPERIVAVDTYDKINEHSYEGVVFYQADVANYSLIDSIFKTENPQIVFHLASQRLPTLAEDRVSETINTNIFGMKNVINLCKKYKISNCVFSSTGKAARYYTPDVYAATKKIDEWLLSEAASGSSDVIFSAARFTHVIENSPVSKEMEEKIINGLVSFHSPDRFIYGQNITEAVNLLLNSLIFSEKNKCILLSVKNLGWPIEVLRIPLYKMLQSGRIVPLYFSGLPAGYEDQSFCGQLDLIGQNASPMLNVLESKYSKIDESGDMIITETIPTNAQQLTEQIYQLESIMGDDNSSEYDRKRFLGKVVENLSSYVFIDASPTDLINILDWGFNPKLFSSEVSYLTEHHAMFNVLVNSLRVQIARNE